MKRIDSQAMRCKAKQRLRQRSLTAEMLEPRQLLAADLGLDPGTSGQMAPVSPDSSQVASQLWCDQLISLEAADALLQPASPASSPALSASDAAGNGSISGTKWNDLNGNGARDAGEPGLMGWSIYADANRNGQLDSGEPSAVTDSDGRYILSGLAAGDYTLGEVAQNGWEQTLPGGTTYPIRRASLSGSGAEGSGSSDEPSISGDGRYVAFQSSSLLVFGDSSITDIFVIDRTNGSLEKVSLGVGGSLADGSSLHPAISSDGRFVAFQSSASNLVSGDTNGLSDVFVFDRQTRTTTLVSVDVSGAAANGNSGPGLDISGDGRYVVFQSSASNLIVGDTNARSDVFVRDLLNGTTVRASVGASGTEGNSDSSSPTISGDGLVVAFESKATNLVPGDTNSVSDIFVRRLDTAVTQRVSLASGGAQADDNSYDASISGDGHVVAFYSYARNLVAGDFNDFPDIFVVDLAGGALEAASRSSSGQIVGSLSGASLSFDGNLLTFTSSSNSATLSRVADVFVRDRAAATTQLVSRSAAGTASGGSSYAPVVSGDGKTVAFSSDAKDLIAGDTNYARDIFTVDVSFPWLAFTQHVVVQADQAVNNVDFGNAQVQADLRGTAWQDSSRDGVRSVTEPSLANRRIYLDSNANGALDTGETSVLTDSLGQYHFSGLPAGTYDVREVLPAKWTETVPSAGSYQRVSGLERSVLIDFEDVANTSTTYRSIGDYVREGFVFSTSSSSDRQWRVYGSQSTPAPPSAELVTDFRSATQYVHRQDWGLFSIDSLDMRLQSSGFPYAVTVIGERADGQAIQQALTVTVNATTFPLSGFDNLRSLRWIASGTSMVAVDNFRLRTTDWHYDSLDFASSPNPGRISGTVYYDLNKSASQDGGDFPLAGREIYLDIDKDGQLDANEPREVSDAAGNYQFDSVFPGNYVLREVQLTGWHLSQPVTAPVYSISLSPEQEITDRDFGNWADPAVIAGTKWNDLNGNGIREAGEPGLAGRTMVLDLNNNGAADSGEPTAVTAADDPATTAVDEAGSYRFENLVPGDYSVREISNVGWRQTSPVAMTSQIERSAPTGFRYTGFVQTPSESQAVSANGRYLAFSTALSLLPADTNSSTDVYWLDRQTDTLELISVTGAGVPGNNTSFEPSISDDGRYVAFRSWASNLVASDTNQTQDIFVRDRNAGTTQRATIVGSTQANSYSYGPVLTGDGRSVMFWSAATNLVPDDQNQSIDTFVKNLDTGELTRANTNTLPPDLSNENTFGGDITADGQTIVLQSFSNDLVPGDTNGFSDIFVLSRPSGQLTRVSTSSTGQQANGTSEKRAISDDGRFVVFDSSATNLTDDKGVTSFNVFLKDLQTGRTQLISRNFNGGAANESRRPDISADGRWIVFESHSQTMFPDSANTSSVIVLYDRLTDSLTRVSQNANGTMASGGSVLAAISRDGSAITFMTEATTIAPEGSGLVTISRAPDFNQPLAAKVKLTAGTTASGLDFGSQFDQSAPTDIRLSSSHVLEKLPAGTLVGQLSAVDASPSDSHLFALVAGEGDADNAAFQIEGDQLRSSQTFDFSSRSTYSVRVRATDTTGNQLDKTFVISIDNLPELAAPVQIGDGTAQRSSLNKVVIEFDGPVTMDANAFEVHKRERDAQGNLVLQAVATAWQAELLAGGHTKVTLTFSGPYVRPNVLGQQPSALVDGNYQLTIVDGRIRASGSSTAFDGNADAAAGGDYVLGTAAVDAFFAFYGDVDGNRLLNLIDYAAFRNAYGKSIGTAGYRGELDYNQDGLLNLQEYTQFRNRYAKTLPF